MPVFLGKAFLRGEGGGECPNDGGKERGKRGEGRGSTIYKL